MPHALKSLPKIGLTVLMALAQGCVGTVYPKNGVKPAFSFPVTNNDTPYSSCLRALATLPGKNLPVVAVGEIADKTGQLSQVINNNSTVLSQGITEMLISAIYKTGKAHLVERFDLRIPLAEVKMVEQNLIPKTDSLQRGAIRGSDFVIMGALTELNYNIVSDGARLVIDGAGLGGRTVVINVALDLRVVNSRTFDVVFATSLQKTDLRLRSRGQHFPLLRKSVSRVRCRAHQE